jgi:superfamily II DNA/RNA helicase
MAAAKSRTPSSSATARRDVDVVALSLKRHGYNAAPLHGDLDQSLRTKTLDRFRTNDLQYLVASDVAARGLDIPDVSHVFNYEPPRHADDYVHRIGRTGRAGRLGASFTLVGPGDKKSWDAIEKLTGKAIEKAEIEGLPEAALGDPRDSGGRGRRAEELKKEHNRRLSEKKQKYVKRDEARPTASTEPVQRSENSPEAKREAEPRREKRDSRPPRNDAPRDERREERRPPRDDNGPSVTGFGDSTPAFLKPKK